MATLKDVIIKHHEKEDGTFNVKIRLSHRRQTAYISTIYTVIKKQLSKDYEIKDVTVKKSLILLIEEYQDFINTSRSNLDLLSAKELADYLVAQRQRKNENGKIDFIVYGRKYADRFPIKEGRVNNSAKNIHTTLNSLVDFFERERIDFTDITAQNLKKFEMFLKSPRKMVRKDRFGGDVTIKKKPLVNGVIEQMSNIRRVFNAARFELNDEDNGEILIHHYPFGKYKLPKKKIVEKRSLSPEQIAKIRDYDNPKKVKNLDYARDVFMLHFYLIGINGVDMIELKPENYRNGRIAYNRSKTEGRRADSAFISIKVEPEAQELIEKYKDPTGARLLMFQKKFKNERTFNQGINVALKMLSEKLDFEEKVTTYFARHSWATIARNVCRISSDDIGIALNHTSRDHQITDLYIKKDWSMVDEANRKVIDAIPAATIIVAA
jgi:integrase